MAAVRATSDYKDLLVWQKGVALVKQVYRISRQFPPDERFGLAIQVRRAAVSIPSNIAEGQARHTSKEFVLFLSHAEGSVAEVDTQLTLAMELGFCSRSELSDAFQLVLELRRMLNSLRRKLLAREH
ncbi:MAG: four helix bundle protein [Acidobacteria bacterium]|nr:four helix bundle protein [Acidobacteriota bacterium]